MARKKAEPKKVEATEEVETTEERQPYEGWEVPSTFTYTGSLDEDNK